MNSFFSRVTWQNNTKKSFQASRSFRMLMQQTPSLALSFRKKSHVSICVYCDAKQRKQPRCLMGVESKCEENFLITVLVAHIQVDSWRILYKQNYIKQILRYLQNKYLSNLRLSPSLPHLHHFWCCQSKGFPVMFCKLQKFYELNVVTVKFTCFIKVLIKIVCHQLPYDFIHKLCQLQLSCSYVYINVY